MRILLICPADRPGVAWLGRSQPLPLVPILGRTLIDLWLSELASKGAVEVWILAADRPELIRQSVGRGDRWGLKIEVLPERGDLTPAEARAKYLAAGSAGGSSSGDGVCLLDGLPDGTPLWTSPGTWFRALREQIAVSGPKRVGFREFAPGVWIHLRARVAGSALLTAPCWIGTYASVGAHAQLGPGAIVEDGGFVDAQAEVVDSFVGPGTYLGAMTSLRESLAWGRGLYRWTDDSFTEVRDDFLVGEQNPSSVPNWTSSWVGRCAALLALAVTSPVLLLAWVRHRPGHPLFETRQAVRAPLQNPDLATTCVYRSLAGATDRWRRWPELWNVVRGEFAWVGNRPLTPAQAAELHTEFERLWLAVPPGLFSLADAEGCQELMSDEGRAHASFYAAKHDLRNDMRILGRVFARALR